MEYKAFRLISSPPLTDCLQLLEFRRNAASLSVSYRYFHAYCSSELAACMPPLTHTRLFIDAPSQAIQIPYARVNQYLYSVIPFTGQLWNRLPISVFSTSYDLQLFNLLPPGDLI